MIPEISTHAAAGKRSLCHIREMKLRRRPFTPRNVSRKGCGPVKIGVKNSVKEPPGARRQRRMAVALQHAAVTGGCFQAANQSSHENFLCPK
jgi:hypothetical protein